MSSWLTVPLPQRYKYLSVAAVDGSVNPKIPLWSVRIGYCLASDTVTPQAGSSFDSDSSSLALIGPHPALQPRSLGCYSTANEAQSPYLPSCNAMQQKSPPFPWPLNPCDDGSIIWRKESTVGYGHPALPLPPTQQCS